jgi:hypothetical protein
MVIVMLNGDVVWLDKIMSMLIGLQLGDSLSPNCISSYW